MAGKKTPPEEFLSKDNIKRRERPTDPSPRVVAERSFKKLRKRLKGCACDKSCDCKKK